MKKRIKEETIIFKDILKWFFLATFVGFFIGLAVTVFLKLLEAVSLETSKVRNYYLFLPLALMTSGFLIKYFAPDAEGHGTEKVIEAIHKKAGKIPIVVVPIKLLATLLTLGFGGSAGKEGPCAQIGAAISSFFASLFKFSDQDRRKFVICGISAAFATVFGTPFAGAIFGVEVLYIGSLLYDVLLPSFVAGVTAYQVALHFGIKYFSQPLTVLPPLTEFFLFKVIFAGLIFGLGAFLLVEIMDIGSKLSKKLTIPLPWKGLLGGFIIVALTYVSSAKFLGLGIPTIQGYLKGVPAGTLDFLWKIIFTVVTLSFAGSGGIITPIFFIGAALGSLVGQIYGLDITTFSALGFVGVLAGAANTPIAASILAIEIFGGQIGSYAALTCILSYLVSGHRTVYPSQILKMKKADKL